MNRIQVRLTSIQVVDAPGATGSDVQLRLEVQDTRSALTWPAVNTSARIAASGPPVVINQQVGVYELTTAITVEYNVLIAALDTSGEQGDYGTGAIVFDLTPYTTRLTKAAVIDLKRPRMRANGQIKVTMTAARLPLAVARA